MKIASTFKQGKSEIEVAKAACLDIQKQLGNNIQFLVIYTTVENDVKKLVTEITKHFPQVPLHGTTSFAAVMTNKGHHHCPGEKSVSLFAISDPRGAYGTASATIDKDPKKAAITAATDALKMAKREGETPSVILLTQAPGNEESIIEGLTEMFGPNVPICGGSSADNDVTGKWSQICNNSVSTNSVVVSVLFSSARVVFSFQNGYGPTEKHATATKAIGRVLYELDNKPAIEVYNKWLNGALDQDIENGGNLFSSTTLTPMGRIAGYFAKIPYFQLSHPASADKNGAITLFSEINEGDEIYLINGTIEGLVSNCKRITDNALAGYQYSEEQIAGAFVIFCAGCSMTLKEKMPKVVDNITSGFPAKTPVIGAYTFGEQGCFIGGENRHGNFMISMLIFLND